VLARAHATALICDRARTHARAWLCDRVRQTEICAHRPGSVGDLEPRRTPCGHAILTRAMKREHAWSSVIAMERNRTEGVSSTLRNKLPVAVNKFWSLRSSPARTLGRLMWLAPPLAWHTEYAHARTRAHTRTHKQNTHTPHAHAHTPAHTCTHTHARLASSQTQCQNS